jgi:hypothetical protein
LSIILKNVQILKANTISVAGTAFIIRWNHTTKSLLNGPIWLSCMVSPIDRSRAICRIIMFFLIFYTI